MVQPSWQQESIMDAFSDLVEGKATDIIDWDDSTPLDTTVAPT